MIRRFLIAATLGMTLGLGGVGDAAFAQSSGAKAAVDAGKSVGLVGEQADGYLGFVSGSGDASLRGAVAEINAGRARAYKDIAARSGVSESAAGEATAQQLIGKLPPGAFYKPLNGGWMRK